jgi:hypothetical protein
MRFHSEFYVNPFRQTIVASPWETAPADVPEIHGHVFNQCLAGVDYVRLNQRSAALVIHGESGSGKTHLLGRLRTRLAPTAPSATYRQEYLYVWVRLQTSPRMIWRTLRRTLVDDWFRPVAGVKSQFQRILYHRLAEIRPAEWDLERWYEYMLDQHPQGLSELLDEIADTLDLDRNTAVAFQHIAFGRHLRDLRAWLAGTSLPEAALERLDLAQDEGTDEEREDEARQVVLMLCRLAGNSLPILMNFDQVEALQTSPDDHEAIFAFGQLISTLHDGTTNVLLTSCVQSAFFHVLKERARRADYDRMTSLGAFSLDPLNRKQAELLIAGRLAEAGDPVQGSRPGCWPLEQTEFDDLLAKGFVAPRQLISLCAERFETRLNATVGVSGSEESPAFARSLIETVPTGPANQLPPTAAARATSSPDLTESQTAGLELARGLQQEWENRLAEKHLANSPDMTEEILLHSLPLLAKILRIPATPVRDEQLPDVPIIFESPAGVRVGLSISTQPNMNSVAAYLKRLKLQHELKRLVRLVIIRDERVPITETAKAAQQHLADLEDKRAVVVHPPRDVLSSLDALRAILSDAKSGNLDFHGETIAPQAVEDWLARNVGPGIRDFARMTMTVQDS